MSSTDFECLEPRRHLRTADMVRPLPVNKSAPPQAGHTQLFEFSCRVVSEDGDHEMLPA